MTRPLARRPFLCMQFSGKRKSRTSPPQNVYRVNPKYHPFWGSPLFYKAPPRQFRPPKCKLAPPKCKLTPYKKGLATSNLQFCKEMHKLNPRQFVFWRRHFAFWRLNLSWGGLIEKGGPQKGWYFSFSPVYGKNHRCELFFLFFQGKSYGPGWSKRFDKMPSSRYRCED